MNPNAPERPEDGATPTPTPTPNEPASPSEPGAFNPFAQQPTESPAEPTAPSPEPVAEQPAQPSAPQSVEQQPPAMTPEQPQPMQPMPPQTPGTGPVAPPPKSNKMLFIILGVAGAIGLLAAAAAIVYAVFFNVTQQDYREAAVQFSKVEQVNSDMYYEIRTLSRTISSSPDELEEEVTTIRADLDELEAENKTLSEMKAVRVGDGADLYATFNTQLQAYMLNANNIIDSLEAMAPALAVCAEAREAQSNDERVSALSKCRDALNEVGTLPQEDFSTFVEAMTAAYVEIVEVTEKLSAITDPYGSQYDEYTALRERLYDVQDDITDATEVMSEGLEAKDEQVSVQDSADALADFFRENQ